jgi:hypothetical protein
MGTDKMQTSRYEQKYIITDDVALQIREFVRSYLELDENGVGKPNFSYPVHSLYLDSADLKTYWDTINGNKNRYKLRLRFYNSHPDSPVFFEIKSRMNNCIQKQRGGVLRSAVDEILAGRMPAPSDLVSKDPKHVVALQNFSRRMMEIDARPKVHIAYYREAYVPHDDNSARLTMDREVRSEPEPTTVLSTDMNKPILVWGHDVVLELKFTNRFPDWFRELVRIFGLRQCGAAKYVDGVALQGEYRLRPGVITRGFGPAEGLDKPALNSHTLAPQSSRKTNLLDKDIR